MNYDEPSHDKSKELAPLYEKVAKVQGIYVLNEALYAKAGMLDTFLGLIEDKSSYVRI